MWCIIVAGSGKCCTNCPSAAGHNVPTAISLPPACSHQDPYAHFSWNFRDILGDNPTYTCTVAHSSYRYDYYTGDDNYYVQQQSSSFYYRNADTNK
jgi:hypothetical protein